jgi:2-oxoglutarate dehydrogenase E2 component (dihydrolipoamide succinyltransferase)
MKVEIKIPAMGESVNEATVSAILKESGASVAMDEEILELETEKVNQVLTAPRAGKLELTVKVDDTVTIGQVIGSVDTEGAVEEAPKPEPEVKKEAPPPPPPPPEGGGVREMEGEFIEGLTAEEKPVAPEKPREESETRKKLPKIRKVIARRLLEAQHTTAMLTTFNEIDMSAVMRLRAEHKDAFLKKHDVKLGFMSFFVKGCVAALQEVPGVNSYIDGDELVQRHTYDIGIAVSTERGLMVPVLRDCDKLSFAGIEQAIGDYAAKARKGGMTVDDLTGGGFTITNGGIFGSLLSTPIINPPQSGILGMHKIQERPVVVGGEQVVRPMMYTALSYDHRVVDGREAVTFLVRLKEVLEEPARLSLEV